jgi:hypothetical protein
MLQLAANGCRKSIVAGSRLSTPSPLKVAEQCIGVQPRGADGRTDGPGRWAERCGHEEHHPALIRCLALHGGGDDGVHLRHRGQRVRQRLSTSPLRRAEPGRQHVQDQWVAP